MAKKKSHWRKRLKAPFRALRYKSEYRREVPEEEVEQATVTMVLLTHNRRQFLSWTLDALFRTIDKDPSLWELIIWDNASTDGTQALLDAAEERPNVTVVRSPENVGINGYARGLREATLDSEYLLELDDDVLWFPDRWLDDLVRAFKRFPRMGFLGASQVHDEYASIASPFNNPRFFYQEIEFAPQTTIAFGNTCGHCALTTRAIYDEVGGFPEMPDRIFFSDDGHYNRMMRKTGYYRAILKTLEPYHATGPHCNFMYSDLYAKKLTDFFQVDYKGLPIELKTDFLETFRQRYAPREFVEPAAPSSEA